MRKTLTSAAILLALSSGAFGSAYWTGSALDNEVTHTYNWGGAAYPGGAGEAIFDAAHMPASPGLSWGVGDWMSLGTATFNYVPNGNWYMGGKPDGTGRLMNMGTINLNVPGTVHFSWWGSSPTSVITASSGCVLDVCLNGAGCQNSSISLTGPGTVYTGGNGCNGSYFVLDCGTLVPSCCSSGIIYNAGTVSALGTLNFTGTGGGNGPNWKLFTYDSSNLTAGRYSLASPANFVFLSSIYPRMVEFFDNATKPSGFLPGQNPTVVALKARLLGGVNSIMWLGHSSGSMSWYDGSTAGSDITFLNCQVLGNGRVLGTQNLAAYDLNGSGAAHTFMAMASQFIPDCGAGIAGILTFQCNLRLMDNNDLNHAPCKISINVTGTGGLAGTDYSQLRVNKTNDGNGGFETGLDNCLLTLNIKSGLDCAALAAESIVLMTSDATDFSAGAHFANDSGGVNGWANGGYVGTLTYNASNITLSGLMLAPVPEPATLALLGSGALGLVAWARRRRMN